MELFSANLTNDTPVFLGGYDMLYGRDNVNEGLRTQSLKGLLRYWMRVYLAGAGYKSIEEKVNSICGGRIKEAMRASMIKLRCETFKDELDNMNRLNNTNIARIKLLRLNKELNFAKSLNVRISLHTINDMNKNDKILVVGSLVTGLLLSGIGKMGRRGFGCFTVNSENGDKDIEDLIKSTRDAFSNSNPEKRIESINDIISTTRKYINSNNVSPNGLPRIHALHPDYCKIFYLSFNKHKRPLDVIRDLQNFVLRSSRSKLKSDPITKNHLAWFLGLPRSQNNKGYIVNKGISRRASPLFIAVHKDFALVSIFKSRDWPCKIEWSNKSKKVTIDIDESKINDAFDKVIETFNRYINSTSGYKVMSVGFN